MKVRTHRPIDVETLQFTGDNWEEVKVYLGEQVIKTRIKTLYQSGDSTWGFHLQTERGPLTVIPGDYLVKEAGGEIRVYSKAQMEKEFSPASYTIFETKEMFT